MTDPRVTAIVVTYRRLEMVQQTVQAVLEQSLPVQALIVVDNDSNAAVEMAVTAASPLVQYLALADNPGFGAGLGAGLDLARATHPADWYLLLDDDSPPAADALGRALDVARSAPSAPALGVVATRGGHIRAGRIRHDLSDVRGEKAQPADFALVDGAIVADAAITAVGGPRRDLFMNLEDIEFTTRIRLAGFGVLVRQRDSSTFHHLGSTSAWRGYYQARNHLRVAIDLRQWSWLWGWLVRETAIGLHLVKDRRFRALVLRWRGAVDALRNRMGRTVNP